MNEFDYLIIGAGMAGLSVASLLAKAGRRVLVIEAHDVPGGYAHTFRMRDFRFCAQVHYIFACGEGETIGRVLAKLGIAEAIPFVRLDPEGFDHIVVGGDRFRIPNGLSKFRERLLHKFPEWREPILRYFEIVSGVAEELDRTSELPKHVSAWTALRSAYRFRYLIRYAQSTLGEVYDAIGAPPRLRAILGGQSGDYLLPPRDVSFLLHVALVHGYDRGAYYPRNHFFHFVDTLADSLRKQPGCALLLEHEIDRIHVESGRVTGVSTRCGKKFTAERYISNVDPHRTASLAGWHNFSPRDDKRFHYEYSAATFTIYLGLRGIDLRDHGFGSYNVWHYPDENLERQYDNQILKNDLKNPWLFMSTPTLHSDAPGICPPEHQILEVATVCDHAHFAALRARDRRAYNREKKRVRDTIFDILESHYIPGLRKHIALQVVGTPATNERFCRAPGGNSYGAALVPKNISLDRKPYRTSLDNLWIVNATAGMPSVAGAMGAGAQLYQELTGDEV
ncbi:MAG: NAD(P)/FAD-dependent oxidoreductase [Polyangiaceae bacterium]|nr:NAD(P)/FAD-dependent oxidoreductase [Polyangiaceae bacterium]